MPSQSRRHTYVETSLGRLLLVAADEALAGLYFPEHWYPPKESDIGEQVDAESDPLFNGAAQQLHEYLAGTRQTFDIPLSTEGDNFSERVWALLREIPYGETTTYGTLATTLGNKNLSQRVGQAVGHNPISIVIPCHRVVGSDGSLTGFAGGLQRKRMLLDLEEPAESRASRLF
jgi:methylated-DNA-[protein]-cysteine S-methyltransferase